VRLAIALVGLLVCLAAGPRAQQPTASLEVQVLSTDGPVAGATVRAGAQTAETDRSGTVRLAAPAGPITITITDDGFVDASVDVVLAAGE